MKPTLPLAIQEIIANAMDTTRHIERRQFYISTLVQMREEIEIALAKISLEREGKGVTPNKHTPRKQKRII